MQQGYTDAFVKPLVVEIPSLEGLVGYNLVLNYFMLAALEVSKKSNIRHKKMVMKIMRKVLMVMMPN